MLKLFIFLETRLSGWVNKPANQQCSGFGCSIALARCMRSYDHGHLNSFPGESGFVLGMQNTYIRSSLIELRMLMFLHFPAFSSLFSLVGSVLLGDPTCSMTSPCGTMVVGVPPAANILPHAKRRCRTSAWAGICHVSGTPVQRHVGLYIVSASEA